MRRIATLILFVSLFYSCTSLQYLDAYNSYKGNPHITNISYYTVLPTGEEKLALGDIYTYDSKGRITRHVSYSRDSIVKGRGYTYEYNSSGNVVKNKIYRNDSTPSVINNYRFNKYGQEVLREHISGKDTSLTVTVYDRKNRTAIIEYISKGKLTDKNILLYDPNWRDIEIQSYYSSGKLKSIIRKEYDENGNETITRWYNSSGLLYEFFKKKFNEKGHPIVGEKYQIKNGDTTLSSVGQTNYRYDTKGNIIYEESISNGKVTLITRTRIEY